MFKLNLLENEQTLAIYRRTEAVLFKPVIIILAFIFFPWYFLLKYELAATYVNWLFLWTVLLTLYGVNKYALWLLNVNVATNKRLVTVEYKTLLNKKVLETPFERILNVSFSVKGFWQTLFGFGEVVVQVKGLPEPMLMRQVAKPAEVKDFLWKLCREKSQHSQEPRPIVRREL
ncbi:MAG TPA: PH domain-containing protein [Candidatus Limnocylindria bacterium]|nr:PH domain-containing protein [Candidatus Limnocylindria bacterium]